MKRYITYKRVKMGDTYLDPNTNNSFENATNNSKFNESPYDFKGVFLASVEYPDTTPKEAIDGLLQVYSAFYFSFITEEEANEHLSNIGDISVDNFIFTDNRIFDLN